MRIFTPHPARLIAAAAAAADDDDDGAVCVSVFACGKKADVNALTPRGGRPMEQRTAGAPAFVAKRCSVH